MSFVWKVGLFPLDYFNHEMLPSSCYHLAALGLLAGPAEGDQPAPAPDTVHAGRVLALSTVQHNTVQYSTVICWPRCWHSVVTCHQLLTWLNLKRGPVHSVNRLYILCNTPQYSWPQC